MASPGAWWAQPTDKLPELLKSDNVRGLTDEQVKRVREVKGWNDLDKEEGKSMFELVMEQFEDKLVRILLAAALVSFALTLFEVGFDEGIIGFVEPIVILTILILNAIVGVWQESNAESALEALKEMASATAHVIRNGKDVPDLDCRELVPGDLVRLQVGDKVPADIRIIKLCTATLRCEQSALTGESEPVNKQDEPCGDAQSELQQQRSMAFSGTNVANGTGFGFVTEIGMAREIGKIQSAISAAKDEQEDSPLKKKLDEFGDTLANVITGICILVWVINYKHFVSWGDDGITFSPHKCTYYFKIAVALAVAAIPEGLPAVITTCLALGTRKMAKRNAIVRKLPSVETLGCTTVICSDKTGTLTTNQMSVVHFVAVGNQTGAVREVGVQGSSYNPNDGGVDAPKDKNMERITEVCALCNECKLTVVDGVYKPLGASTEAALRVFVEKVGKRSTFESPEPENGRIAASLIKQATLEFDRTRKSMSVIAQRSGAPNLLLVKGAPEHVISRCTKVQLQDGREVAMDDQMRKRVDEVMKEMSSRALRCLALAYKGLQGTPFENYTGEKHPAHKILKEPAEYPKIESDLVFCGLVGLQDPPRVEARESIRLCKKAGIRVIMITGDNKDTAEAIAKDVGIISADEDVASRSMVGRDFAALKKEDQIEFLMKAKGGRVFSRAEPVTKQDIVRLLKAQGEITAMTGDGVNDAPALKLADIGIAMGITGTEVAKEASDMVLADDNFSTIVSAIEEGRSIYANMKAFIRYMISSNIGEVASIFMVAALGLPEGMNPVQLLWVNLVTDGPPATALGFNPPDPHVMQKLPRRKDDVLISGWVFFRYMVIGMYVGCATVGIFVCWYTTTSFFGIDLSGDGHPTVTLNQLLSWSECGTDTLPSFSNFTAGDQSLSFEGCDYYGGGKIKAATLSLTVLVAIEMLNAFNALSEDGSLLTVPPWANPYLIVAAGCSFGLHCLIMYIPMFASIFSIVPLSAAEWMLVMLFSFPVILIDEVLKFFGRQKLAAELAARARSE